jgi:PiT family inorganic phosphate transporter
MLILIGIVPVYFALDHTKDTSEINRAVKQYEMVLAKVNTSGFSASDTEKYEKIKVGTANIDKIFASTPDANKLADKSKFMIRKNILLINKSTEGLIKSETVAMSAANRNELEKHLKVMKSHTDYAPNWVIMVVALSLGLGTMIGWKRIVKTIGEKIGKEHLTYAQGASAELMAAGVIGFSTFVFKLPVSTTHILSSGIAGSMVANRGIKNLNAGTIRNIALAWVLTLPVSMFLSGALFLLFRWMI